MKKSFLLLLACWSTAAIAQTAVEGDSWKSVKQNNVGTLSIVYYECPRLIEEVNGQPKGVCVDILNDFVQFIKTKYNKNVELKFASKEEDFGQFLKTVKSSNNIIGVSNTTINDERKADMKFSPYYLKTPLVVLTNKNAPNYASLKELADAGLAGQVEKETSYAAFMEKIKSDEFSKLAIQYQPTTADALKQLSSANKYFSVMDFTEYLGEVKLNPNIKRQPINLNNTVELGFVMSKRADWDVLFNEFLTETYRNSLPYKKSITTNLGANFMTLVK
jgi:ABC-type amino acid transport substrate-binding protein